MQNFLPPAEYAGNGTGNNPNHTLRRAITARLAGQSELLTPTVLAKNAGYCFSLGIGGSFSGASFIICTPAMINAPDA